MKKFALLFLSFMMAIKLFSQISLDEKIVSPSPAIDVSTHGIEVCVNGNHAFAASNLITSLIGGQVRTFNLQGDSWVQTGVLSQDATCGFNDGTTRNLRFGESLSSDGDWLVVGAPSWDSDCLGNIGPDGVVFIYKRNGINWDYHSRVSDSNFNVNEYFGGSVSIDGNWLIVGAKSKITSGYYYGNVFIYRYDDINDEWDFFQMLSASDAASQDQYGNSVEVNGNSIIVGAYYKTLNGNARSGAVYLYNYNGASWGSEQILNFENTPRNSYFGKKVAVNGDYGLISFKDISDGSKDKVRVIKNTAGVWATLQDLSTVSESDFGYDLSISNEFCAITDMSFYINGASTGVVYLYELVDNNWGLIESITPSDGLSSDQFGYAVHLNGGKLMVGSPYNDDPVSTTGKAYLYSGYSEEPQVQANFTMSPMLSPATTNVQYTDASTAVNTVIVSWSWDFDNDGLEDSNEQNPTHQFASAGNYPVSLTVSDGTIENSVTKWITHLSASNTDCLSYIPFSGTEPSHQGVAGWNTNGNGEEPLHKGHMLPPTYDTDTAYYYLASRDYSSIDPASPSAMSGNAEAVNWPNLSKALSDNSLTTHDLHISFGLMSLGNDVLNEDWTFAGITETRLYKGGIFNITLNGEAMITGPMPTLQLTINYNSFLGGEDQISAETEFALPENNSAGSSETTRAIAAAFMLDCEHSSIKFLFSAIEPALQMEFNADGRFGGFFDVKQGYLLRSCNCFLNVMAGKHIWSSIGETEQLSASASNGTEAYTYEWSPSANLDDANISNPNVNVTDAEIYTVRVIDDKGCTNTDSMHIYLVPPGTAKWNGKGEWDNTANWSDNIVPASNSNILVESGTLGIDQNVEAGIFIVASESKVIIDPNITLVADSIKLEDNYAEISVYADQFGSGNIVNSSSGVQANIQKYFVRDMWHYFGMPISDGGVAGQYFANSYLLSNREEQPETAAWFYLDSLSQLFPGVGYAFLYSRSTNNDTLIGISGTLNTGVIEVPTAFSGSDRGWNLVSNPYLCTVDWDIVNNNLTNVNDAIYLWDPTLNNGDGAYATWVDGESTNGQTQYIASSQAFFVKANTGAGSVVFTDAAKTATPVNFKSSEIAVSLKIEVTDIDGRKDETILRFKQDATNNFDGQFDALKLIAPYAQAPQIYSLLNNEKYSINSISGDTKNQTIIFEVLTKSEGKYKLLLSDNHLLESCIGFKFINLQNGNYISRSNESITFNGINDGRFLFELQFNNNTSSQNYGLLNPEIKVFDQIVEIRLNSQGQTSIHVFNLQGQILLDQTIHSDYFSASLPQGNFIVQLLNENGQSLIRKINVN